MPLRKIRPSIAGAGFREFDPVLPNRKGASSGTGPEPSPGYSNLQVTSAVTCLVSGLCSGCLITWEAVSPKAHNATFGNHTPRKPNIQSVKSDHNSHDRLSDLIRVCDRCGIGVITVLSL